MFVLVSDHAERMLPTIRSRVVPVPFRRLSSAQLTELTGDPVAARAALGDAGRAERLASDAGVGRAAPRLPGAGPRLPASIPGSTRPPPPRVITDAAAARSAAGPAQVEQEAAPQLEGVDDNRERKALEKRIDERAKRTARRAQMEEVREAVDIGRAVVPRPDGGGAGRGGSVVNSDLAGELVRGRRTESPADAARAVLVVSEARRSLELNVQPASGRGGDVPSSAAGSGREIR